MDPVAAISRLLHGLRRVDRHVWGVAAAGGFAAGFMFSEYVLAGN